MQPARTALPSRASLQVFAFLNESALPGNYAAIKAHAVPETIAA
jgi:hypothetical protein